MKIGVGEEGNRLGQEALYSGYDRVKGRCNSSRAPRKVYIVIEKETKKRTRRSYSLPAYLCQSKISISDTRTVISLNESHSSAGVRWSDSEIDSHVTGE